MPKSDWFERVWEHREEVLYPGLFGKGAEGIFTIPMQNFENVGISDPRWTSCGVVRYAPTDARNSWLYVSSGLSNEWFEETPDPNAVSGFGCEFVIETPRPEQWPIFRLHQIMCYQIAMCLSENHQSDPISINDRIPLNSPIDWQASPLTYLLVAEPTRFPPILRQDSGSSAFLQLIGISESEREHANRKGIDSLVAWLSVNSDFPTTDAGRRGADFHH